MSEITTTTGKSIGDYEDYHDGHSDVAYFESDAVIPLAGKYAASDEAKTTKSVKLATVLGGGSAPAAGGGIELNNGELQLQSINSATENQVPYKTNNGIGWKEPAKVIHGNGVNVSSGAGFSVSANLTAQGGLSFDDGADGQKGIKVDNPVPAPNGDHSDQGKVLTVNDSDQVVWDEPAGGLPDTTGHSQGDVLTIGVSGPNWTAPVHIPIIGTINISPTPSYNYVILQNFLDGHTIGTPISDSDHSDFYNQYPADISTLWYTAEDWSDTNLVSTTPGDQLLYSENGFDFSKYGLTAGQIPFGFCNCYDIYDGAGYANITLPSEWTLETWFYSPLGDGESTDPFWGSFFEIGSSYPNLIRLFVETNSISLHAMGNELFDVSKTVTNQAWHHVALSCDGTNLYTFYDGELVGTVAIASVSGLSTMLASAVKVMVNVDSNGNGANTLWYAQLALCDSCKWTEDFTPSKEAY